MAALTQSVPRDNPGQGPQDAGGLAPGTPGAPGVGVATGGTTGQKLTKTSGADFATAWTSDVVVFQFSISDLVTALATGTNSGYFDAPFPFTITEVIATLLAASTSGLPQFNLKKNGTTILSTQITVDANETSSLTAAAPPVVSVTAVAKGDRITCDIVAAGTGAKGAQITVVGTKP